MKPVLYIVTPCYNEEEALKITTISFVNKLRDLIDKGLVSKKSKVLFVDDGSKDKTWEIIEEAKRNNPEIKAISFKENRGQQQAILAGLMEAKDHCDIAISLDCDGQHDINIMDEMIMKFFDGNEIVYAIRLSRDTDSFFKKMSAQGFYWLASIIGAKIVDNSSDYRLISKNVINVLEKYKFKKVYLKNIVPTLNFPSTTVEYEVLERVAGETKYTFKKMFMLALNGFASIDMKRVIINLFFGLTLIALSLLCLNSNITLRKADAVRVLMVLILIFGIAYLLLNIYILFVKNKEAKEYIEYEIKERI